MPWPALAKGVWRETGQLAKGRADPAITALEDGRVLLSGGKIGLLPPTPTGATELFHPADGLWAPTSSMLVPRFDHTASLLTAPICGESERPSWCGSVLAAGGTGQDGRTARRDAEIYSPATGGWTSTPQPMNAARSAHTATVLRDGRVLVVGGRIFVPREARPDGHSVREEYQPIAAAEIYDPQTASWSADTPPLEVPRYDHTATLLSDGRVLVVGGSSFIPGDRDATPPIQSRVYATDSAEIYDPATNRWSPAARNAPLAVARSNHSATLLDGPACGGGAPPDWCGEVLVTGGFDTTENARRSSQVYDPAADRWDPAPSMAIARGDHASALLPDGRPLMAGGGSLGAVAEDSAEVYDPASGTWSFTGSLRLNRRQFSAVTLGGSSCGGSCGKVLIAGGARGNPTTFPRPAELYDPTAPTAPARVGDLAGTVASGSSVVLTFSATGSVEGRPPPATRYVIKQSRSPITDEQGFAAARSLCGTECSFSPDAVGDQLTLRVTGLTPNVTYHYALRARDGEGNLGPISNPAQITTNIVKPGPVRGLGALGLSASTVRLRFSAAGSDRGAGPPAGGYVVKQSRKPIRGERGFRRARTLCGGLCTFSPRRVGQMLTLRVRQLRPRTTYHYAVQARDDSGNLGPPSGSVRARTLRDTIPPGRVTHVGVRAVTATKVELSFSAAGSNRAGPPPARKYVVKQATKPIRTGPSFLRAGSLCGGICRFSPRKVGDTLTLTINRLRTGATYHYAIRARDDAGNLGPRSRSRRVLVPTRGGERSGRGAFSATLATPLGVPDIY